MKHKCFHCGQRAVIWDTDADFEDFGFEGDGVVLMLHCAKCGAEIIYKIPADIEGGANNG